MQRKEANGVEWLEFDLLAECKLRHGVFTRRGGFSEGAYKALNCSYMVGDLAHHVDANLEIIKNVLKAETLARCYTVHGKELVETSEGVPQCDGLMSTKPSQALLITHADCQAAILYDPTHHAVAVVHAGWRGQVQNIYAESIARMQATYGSLPADLLVALSPSLGPDSSEFMNYKNELPESFWQFQIKPNYFDLWEIASWQLQQCGILPHHIENARIDTYTNPTEWFSFRRDKITGRNATVALLSE